MTDGQLGERVIVTFDGSSLSAQAFPLALALAGDDAAISVVHIHHGDDDAEARLDEVTAALGRAGGRSVEAVVGSGDVAGGIVAEAERIGASVIVMSTRGRGGLSRMAFGSVAHEVLKRSHVSVALIHGHDDGGGGGASGLTAVAPLAVGRIVVPLDGTDRSASALPVAAHYARRFGVPVLLVSTVNLVPLASGTVVQDVGMAANLDQVYEETREAAGEWLAAAAAQLDRDGIENSSEFLTGSAAPSIEGLAKPGDLIVMATHDRGGLDRLVSGSVSDQLIRSGVAPVLVVRTADQPV